MCVAMLFPTLLPQYEAVATSSPIQIRDDRVAMLWLSPSPATQAASQICTAAHIEDNLWITALHCIPDVPNNHETIGFIEQADGEFAGIQDVIKLSADADIAILKVGAGITAEKFNLPTGKLRKGDTAKITGFSLKYKFSSQSEVIVKQLIEVKYFPTSRATDLYETEPASKTSTCAGDSGGPIFVGDTIYAVHLGSDGNPDCDSNSAQTMWHSDIYSRADWIRRVIRNNNQPSAEELEREAQGRNLRLSQQTRK